jgi:hypothetical protein
MGILIKVYVYYPLQDESGPAAQDNPSFNTTKSLPKWRGIAIFVRVFPAYGGASYKYLKYEITSPRC